MTAHFKLGSPRKAALGEVLDEEWDTDPCLYSFVFVHSGLQCESSTRLEKDVHGMDCHRGLAVVVDQP